MPDKEGGKVLPFYNKKAESAPMAKVCNKVETSKIPEEENIQVGGGTSSTYEYKYASRSTKVVEDEIMEVSKSQEMQKGNQMTLFQKIASNEWSQIIGLGLAMVAIVFGAFQFAFDARFAGISDRIEASNEKLDAISTKIDSKFDSLNTQFAAFNQRLDDQKAYIDAKTEKR